MELIQYFVTIQTGLSALSFQVGIEQPSTISDCVDLVTYLLENAKMDILKIECEVKP